MAKQKSSKSKSSKKEVSRLIPILIQTVNNVFRTLHISPNNKYKYESKGRYPNDKRKFFYSKKREYYIKENIPLNLRRMKKTDKKEYSKLKHLKDKKDYDSFDDEYNRYLESKSKRRETSRERKKAEEEAKEEELKLKKRRAKAKAREEEKARELIVPIRVWAKIKYNGRKPLFIEAFIDGFTKDEASLRTQLLEFIDSNFNEEIGSLTEIGIEGISKISQSSPELKYKSSLSGGWNIL